MISSHARCDQCEKPMIPLHDECMSEDYLLDGGWVVLKWTEGDEDGRMDVSKDFCSFECVARWSTHEVATEAGRADDRAGA